MKKSVINNAIAAILIASAPAANAGTFSYNWDGFLTLLNSTGGALANNSINAKAGNQFQTPISGTLTFDTLTGAGTGTLVPFDFFSGSLPAEVAGISMQAIGDGMGGTGTLILGNMLASWGGLNGIPASVVLDAAGFFANELTAGGVNSAIPASDGTYTNSNFGYLGLGPVPIATTEWDVTLGNGCFFGNCLGNEASGVLPLVNDMSVNSHEYAQGDGVGIGGTPMADGPFAGKNPNFDIVNMSFISYDPNGSIDQFCNFLPTDHLCTPPQVPIPAAVWLFGSGLLGLLGAARCRIS